MSYKEVLVAEEYEMEEIESGLTFVGLTGMIDPARVEVPEAIKVTHHTGIKTVMVKGDHRLTTVAIVKEIGVLEEKVPGSVMTGEAVEEIDDVRVFARISFEHKMRIAFVPEEERSYRGHDRRGGQRRSRIEGGGYRNRNGNQGDRRHQRGI